MTSKIVLVHVTPANEITESNFSELGAQFFIRHCDTEDELIEYGHDADVLIASSTQPFSPRVFERLERCRLIAIVGIGFDGVDLTAATESGVLVSNNPFYCIDEVSDHAMALVLGCARKVVRLDMAVRAKRWLTLTNDIHREILPPLSRLRGQTLGIVGFGNIGRVLLPKAKGFGLHVIAHDPFVAPNLGRALGVQMVDFERLLAESDFITLHAALTPQTHHLFGAEQFEKMKRTAYIVNTSRGGLIDERALLIALKEGIIAGAGLDVSDDEPLALDSPFLGLDNVILSGHTAYFSNDAVRDMWQWPVDETLRVLRGQFPQALVNPNAKDRYIARWSR